MNNTTLVITYTLSAVLEIVGIAVTARGFIREVSPGLADIQFPKGWRAARGPITIVLGILVGFGGNIASLVMR